ncbi:uncharacterized protein I206_101198 [Kwoniella pini CBS 10737]|uniref:WSC domain-containing protein n=1 Tax=Kwoniella pini CBS 10737 TaxID=1296096 RepID=A0A1B9IBA2_9TREE|nr:uncharacterized protein I206_00125 [Kwoniella pini CBS 10737]OCF52829.1 hypothetical protein I206_00125 [Kwoniella pini CBS 10737]
MFTQLLSLLPILATANAYFILQHPILETTRLDPIVNPGDISSHVHSIVGGNNFDKTMSYASTQQSTCTTAPVSVDKSNYWIPQLYYYNPSGQNYQAIPVAYVNTYYLPRYSPGETTVQAFPDGLRMISGSPDRRTYNGDAESNAISYVCLDYYTSHTGDPAWAQRNSFFEHNCPQGMRAQVFFPSCWDGVNLDSDDHKSHMAWPSNGVDGGSCPSTHPVRLVSLFYEFIFQVANFPYNNGTDPTYVWANGDTTGYGLHADFVNGWPSYNNGTNILQQALNNCNDDNGVGGDLDQCAPFVPYLQSGGCSPLNDQVNEDVGLGHYISQIPGNNPIWIGNVTKPSYANYSDDDITYTDFKSVIPTGWSDVGCIAEGTSGRALAAASFANNNMTRGGCVSWCSDRGYPLAGIEYGRECYCDFSMRNGASNTTLLDSSKCAYKCANNTNENCGGSSTLELFQNPALYPVSKLPTGWSSNGCVTEGSSSRALTGYSFATSSMTQELCMSTCQAKGFSLAGIEYASECYCGNAFTTGAVPATDNCNMVCSGNKLETCGGPNRLTTFKFANTTTIATSSSASASASASASSSTSSSAKVSSTSASASASSSAASSAKASSSSSAAVSSSSSSAAVSSSSSSAVVSSTSSAVVSSSTSKAVSSTSSSSSVLKGSSSSARASSSASTSIAKSTSSAAKSTSSSIAKSSTSSVVKSSTSSSAAKSSTSSVAKSSTSSAVPTVAQPVQKFAVPASFSTSSVSKSASSSAAKSSSTSAAKSSSSSVKPSSSSLKLSSSSSSSVVKSSSSAVKPTSTQKASSSVASSTSSAAASSSSSSSAAAKSSSSSSVVASPSSSSSSVVASPSLSSSAAASSSSSSSAAKSSSSSSVVASSTSSAAASSSSSSAAKSSTSSSVAASSSSSASAAAKSSSSSSLVPSSTSSATPSASVSAGAYMGYVGCFKDTSGGRHLNGSASAGSNMNNEVCTSYCASKGYAYAGTEYAQECYCGNYLNMSLATIESKCNTPCRATNPSTGSTEICGGGMILSVYTTGLNANAKPYGTKPNPLTRRSAKFRL